MHISAEHRHTVECLAADLSSLGMPAGRDVLVHSAMSRIGRVEGGAATLFSAIQLVIGPECTITVPAFTTIHSPTSRAFHEATRGMRPDAVTKFVDDLPGFDRTSRTCEMGRLANFVLNRRDSVRSAHPLVSFAASGPRAVEFMSVHELECHLGESSPIGALYKADASILLLGVGYDSCSAVHLAEYRLRPTPAARDYTCYVIEAGRRMRKTFSAIHLDDGDFPRLGKDFDAMTRTGIGLVGGAVSRSLRMRELVDFAVGWMTDNRPVTLKGSTYPDPDTEPRT